MDIRDQSTSTKTNVYVQIKTVMKVYNLYDEAVINSFN